MDHTYSASTVEMDRAGYDSLQSQLLNNKGEKPEHQTADIRQATKPENEKDSSTSKKFVFKRGDQSLEVDEDYELEFMADKRPTRLTLRELKDRAAGDIAVKNRMHSLAEEKKRVQSTFKQFSELAKTDPLGALEYIASKAKESDNDFEYQKYLEKLADQAEKLGQMDEKERKAWELEKQLEKAKQDLSQKERTEAVVREKQRMLSEYPEIGDRQFGEMVEAVLGNEELSADLETEHDVMNRVEDLIQETLIQKDIISVIQDVNPAHIKNNSLIFSLSDQIRQNPDLDEEDIRDIIRDLIGKETPPPRQTERERDVRTLSNKARQANPVSVSRTQNADPYDLLREQLLERKQELAKTPLYKR